MTGPPTALVLSGGGARGAYEAGLLCGVVEALGLGPADPSPFQVFVGTSVGAINAAFVAAHAQRGDLATQELCRLWTDLTLRQHLDVSSRGLLTLLGPGLARRLGVKPENENDEAHLGGSVLDPSHLEATVRSAIPWEQLHANVDAGVVRALVVAALRISDGRTTMFADLAPGVQFEPSRDPARYVAPQRVTAAHVLASAAIPLVFPSRRIGASFYCDGGLRFNTPIAPAIRTGAQRLVVVSLRYQGGPPPSQRLRYPTPIFLLGKVLDALLLDPIRYDLDVLARFNQLVTVLEETLTPEELARVDAVVTRSRGLPYRRLDTLVFSPSEDIGAIAGEHLRDGLKRWELPHASRWLLQVVARTHRAAEADLASFLLFDGTFARHLVELGHADALARADEVRAFFGRGG